jgi:hypothetical protein
MSRSTGRSRRKMTVGALLAAAAAAVGLARGARYLRGRGDRSDEAGAPAEPVPVMPEEAALEEAMREEVTRDDATREEVALEETTPEEAAPAATRERAGD